MRRSVTEVDEIDWFEDSPAECEVCAESLVLIEIDKDMRAEHSWIGSEAAFLCSTCDAEYDNDRDLIEHFPT